MAKGSKNSKDVYGADGKTNVLLFKPENLTLVQKDGEALFDPRVHQELSEEFIANIDFHGVIEPVVVRKNTETGQTEVVAGRQRVRAALEVNKRRKKRGDLLLTVPGIIRRGNDLSMMAVMASENEARTDNTPMQRAELVQRMMARGAVEKDVAVAMACSPATIKNLIGLLEAPKAVQQAVNGGKISASLGYRLSKMPAEEAKAKLAEATTQAPKEKKKRTGAARRQQEIVTGEKVLKTRMEIVSMKDTIDDHPKLAGEIKRVMVAVCDWMMGDPRDLEDLVYPDAEDDDDDEEETVG